MDRMIDIYDDILLPLVDVRPCLIDKYIYGQIDRSIDRYVDRLIDLQIEILKNIQRYIVPTIIIYTYLQFTVRLEDKNYINIYVFGKKRRKLKWFQKCKIP